MEEYNKFRYNNLSFLHSGKNSYDRMIYSHINCMLVGLYEWGVMIEDDEFIKYINIKNEEEKIDKINNIVIHDLFEGNDFKSAIRGKTKTGIVFEDYYENREYDNVLFCIAKGAKDYFCVYKTEQEDKFDYYLSSVCYLSEIPISVFDQLINENKLNIKPKYDFPIISMFTINDYRNIIDDKIDVIRLKIKEHNKLEEIVEDYYKLRHDMVLYLLLYSLKLPPMTDVTIEGFSLTPDIFYDFGDRVIIGDVSITLTPSLAREKKRKKYLNIINYFKMQNKEVIEAFYCFKPNLVDLDHSLKYPRIRFNKYFPIDLLTNYFEELKQIMGIIYENYEREDFNLIKQNKFGKEIFESYLFKQADLDIDIEKVDFYEPTIIEEADIIENYKKLLREKEVFEKYMPRRLTVDDIEYGYMELCSENLKYLEAKEKYKPSLHMMVPFFDPVKFKEKVKIDIDYDFDKEQSYIVKFLTRLNSLDNNLCFDNSFVFLKEFSKSFIKSCSNLNSLRVLNEGEDFLSEYKINYQKSEKKHGFFDFLRDQMDFPSDDEPYFVKRKILRIPHNNFSMDSREYWKESGTSFKAYNKVEEKAFVVNKEYHINAKATKRTIDIDESYNIVNDFIDYLTETDDFPINVPDHYKYSEISDHPSCNTIREMMVEDYYPYLEEVYKTRAHKFHKFSSDCYDQLLHFSSFTMSNNRYAIYNCGIKNFLTIVCMSYKNKGKDVGQAYMNIGYGPTSLIIKYQKIFGKVMIIEIPGEENICLYYTNWRRLPGFKLTFLRDSYFSVLSSSVISLMRDNMNSYRLFKSQVSRKYTLRTIISLCSNQQLAEFLMDMRYYQVSLFSLFTNIKELIVDKFKPPYTCALVGYVIRLIKESKSFYENIRKPGSFVIKGIVIDELGRRSDKSVGFQKIQFGSFFQKGVIFNEQDLLDDLFCYVHTMKEPSNVFHEEIKALNTIKNYEEKYRQLDPLLKNGNSKEYDDFVHFYKNRKEMGFISGVIVEASKKFISKLKPDISKIISKINDEYISELTSTKAVVENDRFKLKSFYTDEVTLKKKTKRYTKRHKKEFERRIEELKLKFNIDKELTNVISELNNIYKPEDYDLLFKGTSERTMEELFRRSRLRVKVHDSILGLMKTYKDKKYDKTIQYCNEFIKDDHEIIADICIKSQYGSKREFYVMNLAAKIYARIFENFFKEIAKICSSEMISVAGDEKIMRMQTILNEAIKYSEENNTNIVYINGDCTKWSASEILQSFASMIIGFKDILPEKMFNFLIFVTKKWANKKIQVPQDVLQKVFPVINETDYLKKLDNDYCIESTHNFLQGVFNYCSSMKAVICAEYTQYLYNKIYPGSKTRYFHMEHSDDYAGVLCFEGENDLIEFKTLHNMVMGACSMTDSAKKTTIQNIMFEFVSLIGFNGSMTYPSIKKTKEIGTNTACIGYAQDMSNVGTRTSEILRIGLPQSCAYYFSRVHNHCIMKAYSCFDKMKNDITTLTGIEKSDLPVELFGETNVLPIFYLLCKGDPNNYRLLKYSKYNSYLISLIYSDKFKNSILNDETGSFEIWSPYYMFKFENKLIKSIKEYFVQSGPDEAKEYWERNITYNFYKPNNFDDMNNWLKYMYYKRSFALAYNRVSRMQMSIRLSHFSASECLSIEDIFESEEKRLMNMRTLQKDVFEILEKDNVSSYDHNMIDFIILKGDDNAKIIYDWFNRVKIKFNRQKNNFHTIATRLPFRATKVPIDNTPGNVIESMFAPDSFEKNDRRVFNKESLYNDHLIVEKILFNYCNIIRSECEVNTRLRALQIIFSILVLSTKKRNVAMLTNRDAITINDFLNTFHSNMFSYNYYGQVNMINISAINSFFSSYTLSYDNLRKAVDFDSAIVSSLSFLLVYLTYLEGLNQEQLIVILSSLYIQQKHRNIPVKDYLSNIDPSLFEQKIEKKDYLMQLAIVKYLFLNDTSVINYLLNKTTTYQFKYIKEQKKTIEGWVGDCSLLLRTFEKKSKFEYFNNEIKLYTQHSNVNRALMTFIIGLENCGLKEKTDIFDRVTYTKDYISKYNKFLKGNDRKILFNDSTGYYYYSNEEGIGLPIYLKQNVEGASNYEIGRNDRPKIKFDMKTFSVMVSGFKFFTLPLLKTFYYPIFKCEKIIINDIDFSRLINYNLKNILFDNNYDINYDDFNKLIIQEKFVKRIKRQNEIYSKIKVRDFKIINNVKNPCYDFSVYPEEFAQLTIKNKDYNPMIEVEEREKRNTMLSFGSDLFTITKATEPGGSLYRPGEIAESRSKLFESLNLEEFMFEEEEFEVEEDYDILDQTITPDDLMKTYKQKKYITIEYKRRKIQRMMKTNRWTSLRILLYLIMGDYRNKYRTILHDSLFSIFDTIPETKDTKMLKTFYNKIIKKTLPLLSADQRIGDYLLKPQPNGELDIYEIKQSKPYLTQTIQRLLDKEIGLKKGMKLHYNMTRDKFNENKTLNTYFYLVKLEGDDRYKVNLDLVMDKSSEIYNNMENTFRRKIWSYLDEFSEILVDQYDDEDDFVELE